MPAGTTYLETAHRITEMAQGIRQRTGMGPYLYADATGLGEPVLELLRKETKDLSKIFGVFFTHGDQRNTQGRNQIQLGKAFLVTRLQTLLQTGRLHLPDTAEAKTLAKDLKEFEIKVTEDANDRYGAFKVGNHDDLVTALGMAVQKEPLLRGIY